MYFMWWYYDAYGKTPTFFSFAMLDIGDENYAYNKKWKTFDPNKPPLNISNVMLFNNTIDAFNFIVDSIHDKSIYTSSGNAEIRIANALDFNNYYVIVKAGTLCINQPFLKKDLTTEEKWNKVMGRG